MKRLMKAKVNIPLILILIGIGIGVTFYTAHSTGISYAGSIAYCFIYDDGTALANGEVGWENIASGTWYVYARLDTSSCSNTGDTIGSGNQVVAKDHRADVAAANSSVNSVGDDGVTYRNSASDDNAREPEDDE